MKLHSGLTDRNGVAMRARRGSACPGDARLGREWLGRRDGERYTAGGYVLAGRGAARQAGSGKVW
jgi:hypothetical protein